MANIKNVSMRQRGRTIQLKSLIAWASVYGKPDSENATVFFAKKGVMVPGVPCGDRGSWGRERDIDCSWQNSVFCEESFGKYRAFIYTFISQTKMPIFFWKGRSSSYILESQPGKLMLETFLRDNNVYSTRNKITQFWLIESSTINPKLYSVGVRIKFPSKRRNFVECTINKKKHTTFSYNSWIIGTRDFENSQIALA